MARIFKQTNVRTRTVVGPNGKKRRQPVLDTDGKPVRVKAKKWTIEYRDAKGKVRRKAGYTDKVSTQQLAARLEKQEARKAAGIIDHTVQESTRPIAQCKGWSSITYRVRTSAYSAERTMQFKGTSWARTSQERSRKGEDQESGSKLELMGIGLASTAMERMTSCLRTKWRRSLQTSLMRLKGT